MERGLPTTPILERPKGGTPAQKTISACRRRLGLTARPAAAGTRPSACGRGRAIWGPAHRRRRTAGTRPTSACQRRGGAGTGRSPGASWARICIASRRPVPRRRWKPCPALSMDGRSSCIDPTSLRLNCRNYTWVFGFRLGLIRAQEGPGPN